MTNSFFLKLKAVDDMTPEMGVLYIPTVCLNALICLGIQPLFCIILGILKTFSAVVQKQSVAIHNSNVACSSFFLLSLLKSTKEKSLGSWA